MIRETQLRLPPHIACEHDRLAGHIAKALDTDRSRIEGFQIIRRTIDARQRRVMVNLTVRVYIDEPITNRSLFTPIEYPRVASGRQVVVVGAGPAGLFAALRLIELGLRPVVLERGKPVDRRRVDVAKISTEGIVNPESNYCFGEGGAGAFSDGKLYTRSRKRGSVDRILGIFVQHGANENILIDAHPHIGSDKLPGVIRAMRQTIIDCGGEVRFETRVNRLIVEAGEVCGAVTADGTEIHGPVILATGHSARDVYEMLHEQAIDIEAKNLAIGVRLEHPQHLIDQIQYHSPDGRGKYLPAAAYNFVTQVDGRGVYSFCMCPGGVIVPAASGPEQLVVNGMSASSRSSYWANSGMVVEVRADDLPAEYGQAGALAMMRYQADLERTCYLEAGRSQVAGAQRMIDFIEGRASRLIPPSSYACGVQPSRLDRWLPPMIGGRLQRAFRHFGSQARGFMTNDAIVIGVETRTSSPVRIPRGESLCHIGLAGLYPCGEGAGYAGGIVSSAIDGERCAEALAAWLTATNP